MAKTQVEQMLQDELSKITREFERAMDDINERLSVLESSGERQTSGDGSRKSDEQSDKSDARRKAWNAIVDTYEMNSPDLPDLVKVPPLCKTCKHATLLDGYLMQFSSHQNYPNFYPTGYIQCQQLQSQMPITTAPRKTCMLKEPDQNDLGT